MEWRTKTNRTKILGITTMTNDLSFCSICKYGKPIKLDNTTEEISDIQFIACKFLLERDIQVAFDSRSSHPCERFEIDDAHLGFLQMADLVTLNQGKWILDDALESDEEFPIILELYPLPANVGGNTHTQIQDARKRIGFFITRQETKEKWIKREGKFIIPISLNDEIPIKTELFEPTFKRITT